MEKQFKTKFNLYLRDGPNKSAKGEQVSVGTILTCIEIIKGELIKGIDDWYKDENGKYFWAGGVEENNNVIPKFIWPLDQSHKRITTPFSEDWILNPKKKHTGIDIATPVGVVVYVVDSCVVKKIGFLDNNKTMAQYVGVEHLRGGYCTAYLHINPVIKVGDKLSTKNVVGHTAQLIGMGSHLHFNVWKGVYDNLISHRGALPSFEYAGKIKPVQDPAFPGNFIDPMSLSYDA